MSASQRLRDLISDKGLTINDLSKELDVSARTIQNYLGEKRSIGSEFLTALTERMGVSASWVLTGAGAREISAHPNGCGLDASAVDQGFIQIKRHPIEVSAGNGADGDVDADTGTGHYAYNKKWLERRGLKPNSLSVISVRGDSMEPEIYNKDLVLLDHTDTHLKEGPIYVVRYSNDVFVKRIQKLPGDQVQLVSKNTDYLPIVISNPEADGVEIIGRVVSSMHEW